MQFKYASVMRQLPDDDKLGDPAEEKLGRDHGEALAPENSVQAAAVGKAPQAFGYVAVDLVVAVQQHAPETGPCLQQPVFGRLQEFPGRFREIEERGDPVGPEDAA